MQFQFLNNLLPAFASTLLHSIWQGLIVALLAGIVLICTRRSSSSFRYLLLCGLFFLFLGGIVTSFLMEIINSGPSTGEIEAASIGKALNVAGGWRDLFVQLDHFVLVNSNLILAIWVCIFVYRLFHIANDLRYVNQLRRRCVSDVTGDLKSKFDQLTKQVGIQKPVRLAESAVIKIPVIIGHLRPVILLPVGVLNSLPLKDVEAVLLHELAHIRRHDYLVNFLQCVTGAIFFFNPGFNWLSSLIRQERENCCDDLAIANTNDKAGYVNALISFKEYSLQSQGLSLGLFGKPASLFQRVARIIDNKHRTFSKKEIGFLVISLTIILFLLPGLNRNRDLKNISGFYYESAAIISRIQAKTVQETNMPEQELNTVRHQIKNIPVSTMKEKITSKNTEPPSFIEHTEHEVANVPDPPSEDDVYQMRAHVEQYRAEAEFRREEAEKHRRIAEEHRKQSALNRIEAEKHRQEAEIHRREAELHRQQLKLNREQMYEERKPIIRT